MAAVQYWSFSWVGDDMSPGEEHGWWVGPVGYTQVIAATAHAIAGNPLAGPRRLIVTSIETYASADGGRDVILTLRNSGAAAIPAYGVDMSFTTP